jgi:hypothetical protein
MSARMSTSYLAGSVYGDPEDGEDPAEAYHEASKLSAASAAHAMRGAARLAETPDLRRAAVRATRRRVQHRAIALPEPAPLARSLGDALRARRSTRDFDRDPMTLPDLAAILRAGYGLTGALPVEGRRPAPYIPSSCSSRRAGSTT